MYMLQLLTPLSVYVLSAVTKETVEQYMPAVDRLMLLLHSVLSVVTKETVQQHMPTIDTFIP